MSDQAFPRFPREWEKKIAGWLKETKFRRRIFGGVDEADVWKKISQLNDMYAQGLIAERARYDALLAGRNRGKGGGAK